jgi:uncharacterized protein (TIGR00725 family)
MVIIDNRPPIIAVFGGNRVRQDALDLARSIGGRIAARGGIVLTGGDGKVTGQVKNDAIIGARSHGGSWIGVLNGHGATPSHKLDGLGLVLKPKMGHQRNFLEAWICDSAIVLPGGPGTVSELVSALCLNKPVLLIGETWMNDWPNVCRLFEEGEIGVALKSEIITKAIAKLDQQTGPMAHYVRKFITVDRLTTDTLCHYAGNAEGINAVDHWLTALSGVTGTGDFPEVEGFEQLEQAYAEWQGFGQSHSPGTIG